MAGKYNLLYKIIVKPEGFDQSEFQRVSEELSTSTEFGAANAMFIVSIMQTEELGRSYTFVSVDGAKGAAISIDDIFKVWAALGHTLSLDEELGHGRRALCKQVHDVIKSALISSSNKVKTDKEN